MKTKIKRLFFVICILVGMVVGVHAQNEKGSLSITLTELNSKEAISGAKLDVYYVASVTEDSSYVYVDEFKDCGILLDDPRLSSQLETYTDNLPSAYSMTTDDQGYARLSELPLGLYFVKQTNKVDNFAPCKSFMVTIPIKENDTYIYDVNASPKTEVQQLTSITIKKEWEVDKYSKIPNEVTIELYNDDLLVKTAILNKQNSWQVTYENMPKSDSYHVKEVNVKEGFTPIYEQHDDVFIVTNVSTLISTGQLVWPIYALSLAGIEFIIIGIFLIRKSGKTHE